jgi:hypothetical protein
VDLTSWAGEKLGGWAFLKEGWGRWATAGVLGIAGAVVEALGESRSHTGVSSLFPRCSFAQPFKGDEKFVANYPSQTFLDALDLGYDDNLTLPILTGAIVWVWLTVVSAMTS